VGEVTITVSLRQEKGNRLAVLVAIPGQPDGSLVLVLSGGADADFGGVLDTVALVPEDGSPRPVREPDPGGTRDAGPDALLAAAVALRTRVESATGFAEPRPGGGYRVELAAEPVPVKQSPGAVGAALGLDPEFIADTGRLPALVVLGPRVLVVPVEDRASVEEAQPDAEALARLGQPDLVAVVVVGPEGAALPDPLPLTVFRAGAWPRPVAASAAAALAAGAMDGVLEPGAKRELLFAPARAGNESDLPRMTVERGVPGTVGLFAYARRVV
jgi:hypothetical protein